MSGYQLIVLWAAMQVGSLLVAALSNGDYLRVVDRGFFQATALFAVWLVPLVVRRLK